MVRSRLWKGSALILCAGLAACGPRDNDRNLDSLDSELIDGNSAGNTRDPAMMSALQDQIMVDPALAGQANNDAVRPPSQPYSGTVPAESVASGSTGGGNNNGGGNAGGGSIAGISGSGTSETLKTAPAPQSGDCPQCEAARQSLTLGALAKSQKSPRTAGCANSLRYSTRWAQRMPADLPLYPDARVSEAAGTVEGGCALRAVSFATNAPVQTVLDWYYTRASSAGYAAETQADGDEHVLGGTRDRDDSAFALFATPRGDGGTDVDIVANNGN